MTETAQENLLKSEFGDARWQAERLLEAMDQAPDFYFQAVQQIKMSKWSNSRVVCLGDTAYVPTPLTGMGTFASHQRCHVLAGELSKLHEGPYPSTSLELTRPPFAHMTRRYRRSPPSFQPLCIPRRQQRDGSSKHFSLHSQRRRRSHCWRTDSHRDNDNDFALPLYPRFEDDDPH